MFEARRKKIFVTRPVKPNLLRLAFQIISIIFRNTYTNDGTAVRKLEYLIAKKTEIKHAVAMSNGTLPLIFLMTRQRDSSVILTTPFSFVATASSIISAGHQIAWADINPDSLNISPEKVSNMLTNHKIDAILATHVFGNLCEDDKLAGLARSAGIPLYYDAAHCMNSNFSNYSILGGADACTISFHATKIFSTGEGGVLLTNSDSLAEEARTWRNFGIRNGEIQSLGQNAKMSEFQAALGIANFRKIGPEIKRRGFIREVYQRNLQNLNLEFMASENNSYLPIVFASEEHVFAVIEALNKKDVYPRRYFFPSLNLIPFLQNDGNCPVSQNVATRILCLPIGKDISFKKAKQISKIIVEALGGM